MGIHPQEVVNFLSLSSSACNLYLWIERFSELFVTSAGCCWKKASLPTLVRLSAFKVIVFYTQDLEYLKDTGPNCSDWPGLLQRRHLRTLRMLAMARPQRPLPPAPYLLRGWCWKPRTRERRTCPALILLVSLLERAVCSTILVPGLPLPWIPPYSFFLAQTHLLYISLAAKYFLDWKGP